MSAIPASSSAVPSNPEVPSVDPKISQVARDFEAIFLRTLLKSLEKTTSVGQKGSLSGTGSGIYGSMVVGTVSDAVTAAGGLGLADLVARHLAAQAGSNKPK